ncbi:MAG: ABC transporter ATP-binding protein [Aureliella sp.]
MNAIEIKNVCKSFRRKEVLSDVTLSVPKGVVFALLGENGAGKSTLIRGLLGYQKFDRGSVNFGGFDPLEDTLELRRRVGYVSDAPGLYDWMTVAQAGWYASGFYADGYLTAYDRLTTEFDLPHDGKIRDLSKGMRAKVALSLAMASSPDVLVLDEPTSGLDPLVRRTFLESMIDRAAAGQTVFLSSHQINEVERVADWIAILHEGRVKIAAPLEDLKSSIAMVTYSLRDTLLAEPPEIDQLEVLSRSQNGRTVQSLVRGYTDQVGDAIRGNANVFDVSAIRPNLEELYLGLTQKSPQPQRSGQASSDVA